MRFLLDRLDEILLIEKARGLLYRDPGDVFFQGPLDKPTAEIVVRDLKYYPGQPGFYNSDEEMAAAIKEVETQFPNIVWSNQRNLRSRAFAILTFDGPGSGQITSFGRFFEMIKPDMTGLWKNNELPGGWQLKKTTSLKSSYYKLKPNDLFPPNSEFATPAACVAAIGSNTATVTAGHEQAIQQILPGMQQLLNKQWPLFANIDENMISAVRDDLGETIGPIAVVQGMINNSTLQRAREDILGPKGNFAGMRIYFPASKTNSLVDSYLRGDSGVSIGISSKGDKGADASVKNISDGVAKAKQKGMTDLLNEYADQVKIIERVGRFRSSDLPLELGQEFKFITESQKAAILELIKLGAKNIESVEMSAPDRERLEQYMAMSKPRLNNPRYNVGYHVLAQLAKQVVTKINEDPKFSQACLKFLNISPIMQLHLKGSVRKNNYQVSGFEVKYPPDFKGKVALDAGKVYSATGINGRVVVAYNPTKSAKELADPADELEGSSDIGTAAAVDQNSEPLPSKVTARSGGAERATWSPLQPQDDRAILGRSRRKRGR